MAKRQAPQDLRGLIQKLEERGYKVKKPIAYVKKTLDVDPVQLEEITRIRMKHKITLRECLAEALELWLEMRREDKSSG